MAFRRGVPARAKILYQQQRVAIPFSHIDRDDGDRKNLPRHNPIYKGSGILDILRRGSPFGAGANVGGFCGSRNLFQDRRFAIPAAFTPASVRKMSTLEEGAGADKIEIMTDMADVLGDTAAQAAPAVGEVAIAAADSFFPVAAVQYMIDYVHTFTGLNWWAAIVLTTVLIRTLQLPVITYQIKVSSIFEFIKPQLEEIQQEMMSRDMNPAAVLEGQAKIRKLCNEYGVTPFTPIKGILLGMLFVGPVFCCSFLAINNMAEKVPSFKEGGAFWFTDLSTPDAMYILPVLSAMIFWIMVECNALDGLEHSPAANIIKNVFRVIAPLTIFATVGFAKAVFCYWITANLYSLAYGFVIKKPEVKRMLGIPDIPPPPPSSGLSFSNLLKKYPAAQQQLQSLPPPTEQSLSPPEKSSPPPPVDETSKPVNRKLRPMLSSDLSRRIKGRKKGSNKFRVR